MKNPLQTFGPNLLGRDFAMGDLHGALPVLQNLFREIHFDPTKDRMFSVTDLVDRGPNSVECLELLRQPWFHGALANHEQMMVDAFLGGPTGMYWIRNGGSWGLDALSAWHAIQTDPTIIPTDEQANIFDLVNLVAELPYMITVNHKNGKKFHIIHAEMPFRDKRYKGKIDDEYLSDPERVRELAESKSDEGPSFTWRRDLFMDVYYCRDLAHEKLVNIAKTFGAKKIFHDGLSHIISGHTIMRHPVTMVGQTNIDTCAYDSCEEKPRPQSALTCIELDTWTFYQATPTTFKVVEPVTVNKEDLV